MNPLRHYPREVLTRIAELAEADPQREVCGFVVMRPDASLEVLPIPNVAGGAHGEDPCRFSGQARSSYLMDPVRQYQVLAELASAGGEVVAVYHSHVEAGAYFSAKDRADAIVDGTPLMPGAEYLVVSVVSGVAREQKRFVWDGSDFTDGPL